jgi:hypothetical protein
MSFLKRKLSVMSSTMDKLAPEGRIPWGKIAWALAVAVVAAWTVGFLAGLLARIWIPVVP